MEDQIAPVQQPGPTPAAPIVPPIKTNWGMLFLFLILGILIGAGGLWGYQKYFSSSSNQPISYSTPSPAPTATPSSNRITRNGDVITVENKFSFVLPENWQYDNSTLVLGDKKFPPALPADGYSGIVYIILDDYPPSAYETNAAFKIISSNKIDVAGTQATKQLIETIDGPFTGKKFTIVYVDKGNLHVRFDLHEDGYDKEFDQILSTFKFNNTSSALPGDLINLIKSTAAADGKTTVENVILGDYKIEGNYAQVPFNYSSGGGAIYWVTKINSTWKIVTEGQESPSCSLLSLYNFPSDFSCNP